MMVSLNAYQAYSPAEDLQTSQGRDQRLILHIEREKQEKQELFETLEHGMCVQWWTQGARHGRRSSGRAKGKKYDVGKLIGSQEEGQFVRDEYMEKVLERASTAWCDEGGVDEKWSAVRSALVTSAEDVLGREGRTGFVRHWAH